MHRLLERQLKRLYGSLDAVPGDMQALLDVIDATYEDHEADRGLLERSLDLTSNELMERNAELNQEIAELERVQAALAASERRYRLIVETATEGIWVIDKEGKTTFVNQEMARLLATTPEGMMGRPLFDFMDAEGKRIAEENLKRREQGIGEQHDFRFVRADGTGFWAMLSTNPIMGDDGAYEGALAMVTDITERRRAEEETELARRRLHELLERRTQFINNTAHELATPLTPLVLQMARLRRIVTEEKARTGLDIIDRSVARLRQLVEDILDAARIQAGRLQLRHDSLLLCEVAAKAVEAYTADAKAHTLQLTFERKGDCPIIGDEVRLGQVMDNLLSNALKFTPAGGHVVVRCTAETTSVVVTVEDDGPGVAPERRALLFQPFSRVHDDDVRVEGTGLGLYVSQGLVEKHGGRLSYEARAGGGSRFVLRLPLQEGHAKARPHAQH